MSDIIQSEFPNLTPEDLLMGQWREIEAKRLEVESKMLALGMEIPGRNPAPIAGRKPKSIVEAVRFASCDMKRNITKSSVVKWIEETADWKDEVNPNTVTSTLQRMRGDLEIVESVKGGKGRLTVYQVPLIYPIDRKQYELLMEQAESERSKGGFQNLIYQLQRSAIQIPDDEEHFEIRISDEMVEKIRRYYNNHGGGGWQNKLKRIFGDGVRFEES
jgi:hypothetical protein